MAGTNHILVRPQSTWGRLRMGRCAANLASQNNQSCCPLLCCTCHIERYSYTQHAFLALHIKADAPHRCSVLLSGLGNKRACAGLVFVYNENLNLALTVPQRARPQPQLHLPHRPYTFGPRDEVNFCLLPSPSGLFPHKAEGASLLIALLDRLAFQERRRL